MGASDIPAVLLEALDAGATAAMEHWGTVDERVKDGDPNQVVTDADIAAGREILAVVRRHFPKDSFLDEEAGFIPGSTERTWIIDPIDGTSNFAAGVPLFGVMIGVLAGAEVAAGGVVLPALRETYLAEAGSGAHLNGKAIHVTREGLPENVLVAWGMDSNRDNREVTRCEARQAGEVALEVRNLRSSNSVFDQMMVARGSYGGCFNFSSRIWDNVAPQAIIKEAGGRYTDLAGNPLEYRKPQERMKANFQWCAAAPAIHEAILQALHRGTSRN